MSCRWWWLVLAGAALPALAASERRGISLHDRQDYAQAISELQPLAEEGSAVSQYYLARSQRALQGRERGQGYLVPVEADPLQQQSHAWYGKAAAQGHADAMTEYALDLSAGYGVEVDYQQALEWMNRAHAAGSRSAMKRLEEWYRDGHIVRPDAARADALSAQFQAGLPASRGEVAARRASQQGQALSQALNASLAQDEARSRQANLVAAQAGDAEAALRLANDAASIVREQPDCPTAVQWYRRAGELGLDDGYFRLGILLSRGSCAQDLAAALDAFATAAKTGHVGALRELARMHRFGHAGSPDQQQAYVNERLYQALGGIDDTPAPLAFSRRLLSPEQLAAAEAEVARLQPVLREINVDAARASVRRIALGDAPGDGGWTYSLTLTDRTNTCARNHRQNCDYVPFQAALVLDNRAETTLACTLRLAVLPFGESQLRVTERRFVTLPGANRAHGVGIVKGSVDVTGSSLDCQRVSQPSMADGTCVMQLPAGAAPTYPAAALRRGQEGLVRVEFLVAEPRARPSRVAVVTSSGVESLDQAAMDFLAATIVHTNCPGESMIAPVEFRLQD